eukprot:3282532-Amphidinium_carterae.1
MCDALVCTATLRNRLYKGDEAYEDACLMLNAWHSGRAGEILQDLQPRMVGAALDQWAPLSRFHKKAHIRAPPVGVLRIEGYAEVFRVESHKAFESAMPPLWSSGTASGVPEGSCNVLWRHISHGVGTGPVQPLRLPWPGDIRSREVVENRERTVIPDDGWYRLLMHWTSERGKVVDLVSCGYRIHKGRVLNASLGKGADGPHG